MSYGVVPEGFEKPTLEELLTDFETLLRGIFGDQISLADDTPEAQLNGVTSALVDACYQIGADIQANTAPSQATGTRLFEKGQYVGIERKEGSRSTCFVLITAPEGTPVLTSQQMRTVNGDIFSPISATVIPFTGVSFVEFQAQEIGPVAVGPDELTEIVTAGTNWTSATNQNLTTASSGGGTLGALQESEADFRKRFFASTELRAQNITEAMRASLLALAGVTEVRIYVNKESATVAGRPANSFEVVIEGGDDAEIAQVIWQNHPLTTDFGTTTVTIQDSQNQDQDIRFTRPTPVPIVVDLVLSITALYPPTGDDDITAAILAYALGNLVDGASFGIGDNVARSRMFVPINSVVGHSVISLELNSSATDDVSIDETERSEFTVGNITVTS